MASSTIIFITGANTGLGLSTVKTLFGSGKAYTILLGARDLSKAIAAIEEVKREYPDSASNVEPVQVDLEVDESIARAYEAVSAKQDRVDVLLNNAGKKGWPKQPFAAVAYRSTKTGLNMMVLEWGRILEENSLQVFDISPGLLTEGLSGDPELIKRMGGLDPTVGAELFRDVVEGRRDADVGKVVRKDGLQPW